MKKKKVSFFSFLKKISFLKKTFLFLSLFFLLFPFNIFSFSGSGELLREKESYIPGEVILKLKEKDTGKIAGNNKFFGVSSIDGIGEKYGIKEKKGFLEERREKRGSLSLQGGGFQENFSHLYKLSFSEDTNLKEIIEEYEEDPFVEYAHLNYRAVLQTTPNDTYFGNQWGLEKIDAPNAWEIETGSEDVVVAVLDTGVDYTHEDLALNMWSDGEGNYGYDFYNDDNDPMDGNFHGTHVAGIISAVSNNEKGVTGVSWNSKIMAVKIFSDDGVGGDTFTVVDAINYAVENGAKIISNSWGYFEGGPTPLPENIKEAIDAANNAGCLVVFAAGNEESSEEYQPGAYSGTLAVVALDEDDEKASFSNYGEWVDVSAPGVSILSTYLGDEYAYASGTSMATPFVSGFGALLWSYDPSLTREEVWGKIVDFADDVDAQNPGYEGLLGSGRINVYNSLSSFSPFFEISDFSEQLPSETAGYDYGSVDITVNEVNGLQAEGVEVSFTVGVEGEDPYFSQTETLGVVSGSGSELLNFNLGVVDVAGDYDATVTVTASNTPIDFTESFSFSVSSASASSFAVNIEDTPIGHKPLIEISNAKDIYENPLEGDYLTEVVVSDTEEKVFYEDLQGEVSFSSGSGSYELSEVLDEGDYIGRVTVNDVEGTTSFSVVYVFVTGVVINEEDEELMEGDSLQLTFEITPETATNKSVSWTSDDESVAVVSESGLVTAIDKEGSATVTVTTECGGFIDDVLITTIVKKHKVTFSEEEGVEGVSLQIYSDSGKTETVGETLFTDAQGVAEVYLEDGDYWFLAEMSEYEDYEGSFSVQGEERNISFQIEEVVQRISGGGGGSSRTSEDQEEDDGEEEESEEENDEEEEDGTISESSLRELVEEKERVEGIKKTVETLILIAEEKENASLKNTLLLLLEKAEKIEEKLSEKILEKEKILNVLEEEKEKAEKIRKNAQILLILIIEKEEKEELKEPLLFLIKKIEEIKEKIEKRIKSI